MNHLPNGCLRQMLSVPQIQRKDLSGVPVPSTAAWLRDYKPSLVSPDAQALEFYCLNHLTSVVRGAFHDLEVLPQPAQAVIASYRDALVSQGARMYAYMLLIVTREARHLRGNSIISAWYKKMPQAYRTFHGACRSAGNGEFVVNMLKNSPPEVSLGEYVESVARVFGGSFQKGYGGKPWKKIAEVLLAMVLGETSLEMMVDTAYSLAHNNGPMFNKGMLYSNYTKDFIRILDVQHSGQIPELVLSGDVKGGGLELAGLKKLIAATLEAVPIAKFGAEVDWKRVQAAGAKGNYVKLPKPPKPFQTPAHTPGKNPPPPGAGEGIPFGPGMIAYPLKRTA